MSLIRRLSVLLVCVIAAAAPTGAQAKGKKKPKKTPAPVVVQTSESSTTRGANVTATATCPAGMIVTGGGFSSPFVAQGLGGSSHAISESKRVGTTGWTVSGLRDDSDNSGAPLALTAFADCRSPLLKPKKSKKKHKGRASAAKKKAGKPKRLNIVEASATTTLAGGGGSAGSGGISAGCPAGQKAVSGGFSSSPPPSGFGSTSSLPLFWQSRREGNAAWRVSAANVSMGARTITAYAYCAPGVVASETISTAQIEGTGPASPVKTATTTTPACPARTSPSGGGFDNPPIVLGATGPIPLMLESAPSGASWRAAAANLSATAGSITAKGYCF